MADTDLEPVGVLFSTKVDQKSQQKSDQTINDFIGLLSDLAIIGKVAGDALSGIWDNVVSNINSGLEQFEDLDLGLQYSVDPKALNELKYVVGQIGGDSKDTMEMLAQADKVIQSFRNPATGAEEIEKFYKLMGTYGVKDQGLIDNLLNAIDNEDAVGYVKAIANLRDELGEQFSNFAKDSGFDKLAALETGIQDADWERAWSRVGELSALFDTNIEGLDAMQDGINSFTTALDLMKQRFTASLGEPVARLGDAFLTLTNKVFEFVDNFSLPEEAKDAVESAGNFGKTFLEFSVGKKNPMDVFKAGKEYTENIGNFFKGQMEEKPRYVSGYEVKNQDDIESSVARPDYVINVGTVEVTSNPTSAQELSEDLVRQLEGID